MDVPIPVLFLLLALAPLSHSAAGKGEKVLVRARFYYGNYDKKSFPPTFDLQFDGNHWTSVETTADTTVFYEVIYVLKDDHTSICLAQTHPNQFPFISALEVRSIDAKMYTHVHSNYALFIKHTIAYGASKAIRYPDDPYDRYWTPEEEDNGYTAVKNDATSIKVEVPEKPPEAVLMNAVTSSSTTEPLILATKIGISSVPIYLIMYFSEVTQLDSGQQRSFVFCVDNDIASDPIVPTYGSVFELYLTNTTATPNTTFSLIATTDSTLPPLINAMELFYVAEQTDGTNSKDVEGLATLQSKFSVLKEWTGDPCLPSMFTWDWVNCSSDHVPRVTALYLNGYGLSGSLPDFSSLDALETMNLADNNLGGSIPTSLSKNKELNLVISGNSDLCSSSSNLCEKTKTKIHLAAPKAFLSQYQQEDQ
ncbi:hypothetical protein FNV43_RR04628 [Rhamnella rubrinervis]|uniref:Malectin-like domain-containing protein n=1 Tax=Rhamnella rubrinervis TaxID=2594499 RepID=A0A8K0HKK1_9ROSA|nr:hypothetical protein FNV43_RR04628 [Rhamnella rubrinervis]